MTKRQKQIIYKAIFVLGNVILFWKKGSLGKNNDFKKIIICSLYFRGDVLFHTPVFRMLRFMFPDSQIDVWVKSRSRQIIEYNPSINGVIVFDNIRTADYNENAKMDFIKKIKFAKKIRRRKYDLYIDLTGKYSTAIMGIFFGVKYSLGINYNGFGFCYSKFIKLDTTDSQGHLVDKYLSIIKYGFDIPENKWEKLLAKSGNNLEIFIDENTKQDVELELKKRIKPDRPLVTIHTTAGWKAKIWEPEKFALLIEKIIKELHSDVIIVGDYSDSNQVRIIRENIEGVEEEILEKLFLPMSLKGTAEIIRRSNVFIGGDSVPLHLAGAVYTSSIGLFGPTNPEFSKPRGTKHYHIYHKLHCSALITNQFCSRDAGKSCPVFECMNGITVNEVFELLRNILNEDYRQIIKEIRN